MKSVLLTMVAALILGFTIYTGATAGDSKKDSAVKTGQKCCTTHDNTRTTTCGCGHNDAKSGGCCD